jgi:hypothetical protein
MKPSCPIGNTLYQDLCYGACPVNTLPANEDPTKCVSTTTCASYAPQALSNDNVFDLVCNKIPVAEVSGACPAGFTAWQTGSCYINCPGGLLENGLSCLKRPIQRTFTSPVCTNTLFWYDGSNCSVNPLSIFFIFLIGIAIYWLITYSTTTRHTF